MLLFFRAFRAFRGSNCLFQVEELLLLNERLRSAAAEHDRILCQRALEVFVGREEDQGLRRAGHNGFAGGGGGGEFLSGGLPGLASGRAASYFVTMSAKEILSELPKLTPSEPRAIRERLFEMEKSASPPSPKSTLADFVHLLRGTPADADFADDLETVNRADRPLADPWDS